MNRRVFISSTSRDLASYRARVQAAVRGLGAQDVAMENFGARDEAPLEECVRLIKHESDFFVGLYAYRYGFVPQGQAYSITQLEYIAATDAGLPRLIYIVHEDVPWLPAWIDRGEPADRLEAFKSQLRTNHICYFFKDEEDLAGRVASDLEHRFSMRELARVEVSPSDRADLQELTHIEPGPPWAIRASELDSAETWTMARSGIQAVSREVYLAHVIEPSDRPNQRFDISIFVVKHRSAGLDDVACAEFFLGRWWGNRIIKVENTGKLIGISTSAYGEFLCLCRVTFQDGYQCLLSRYIDFEMEYILKG